HDVNVRAADPAGVHLDDDLAVGRRGVRHLCHPEAAGAVEHDGPHGSSIVEARTVEARTVEARTVEAGTVEANAVGAEAADAGAGLAQAGAGRRVEREDVV